MVRNRVIGILRLKRSEESQSWSQADIQVVKSLAEQLGIALESARTYQTTQSMAQRERLLGEISARVRETLDIEAIIKTTAQEVHKALDVSRVTIRLGKPAIDVDSGSNGHRNNPEGRAS